MRKTRGFKLGKRLCQLTRWVLRKTRIRKANNGFLGRAEPTQRSRPIAKLIRWGRRLSKGAKSLCRVKPGPGYVALGQEPAENCPGQDAVPKGHLAVYVGQKDEDEDFHRVLVPVIYFNHPLFSELLREAEDEYGFHHQGGITIPCRFSEFERVQTRIASGSTRNSLAWKRHHHY